jgi:hypothetical protein
MEGVFLPYFKSRYNLNEKISMTRSDIVRSHPYFRCTAMILFICLIVFLSASCSGSRTVIRDDEGMGHFNDISDLNIVTYPDSSKTVISHGGRIVVVSGMVAGIFVGGFAGGMIGGLIGEAIFFPLDRRDARELINTYSLEDPILNVKGQFVSSFSGVYKFTKISESLNIETGSSVDHLKAKFEKGLVLDFKSTSWILVPHFFSVNKYDFVYSAQARVVSLDRNKTLWEGNCFHSSYQDNTSPLTIEQLTENNGELLKAILKEAGYKCGEGLFKEFSQEKKELKSQ